jgi:hypothetical protein
MKYPYLLSIQIPYTHDRQQMFDVLREKINRQIKSVHASEEIELIWEVDNKEISIGAKRQLLYERSQGKFSVQIDSDDDVSDNFVSSIMTAIYSNNTCDCVTYKELIKEVVTNNRQQRLRAAYFGPMIKYCNHSIKYHKWDNNDDGFNYVRTPYHKDVIRTSLCLQAGVSDMRFGEDEDFAKRILPLLLFEVHIDEFLYIYNAPSNINHAERYGIR